MAASCVSLLLGLAVLLFGPTHCVVLEAPESPVAAGSDVTLRCKTDDGSSQNGYFYRNSTFLGSGLEFTISDFQPPHEGFYWCSSGLFRISSKTWLRVRDPDPDPDPSSPTPTLALAWQRLLCHLVVVCLYLIPTILMVSICCNKRTGNTSSVSMEMHALAEGSRGRAKEHDYSTTEHDF